MRASRLAARIVTTRSATGAPRSTLQLTVVGRHPQRRGLFDALFHNKVPKGFGNFFPKNGRGSGSGAKEGSKKAGGSAQGAARESAGESSGSAGGASSGSGSGARSSKSDWGTGGFGGGPQGDSRAIVSLVGLGLLGLMMSSENNGKEINWQEFQRQLLESGEVRARARARARVRASLHSTLARASRARAALTIRTRAARSRFLPLPRSSPARARALATAAR